MTGFFGCTSSTVSRRRPVLVAEGIGRVRIAAVAGGHVRIELHVRAAAGGVRRDREDRGEEGPGNESAFVHGYLLQLGGGLAQCPLMQSEPVSQQSAAVVHFSNSCAQPVGGGTQFTRPPSPSERQKPPQHSSPDLARVAVLLAGIERPEAAHVARGQLLLGQVERGVAGILAGRRVDVDGGSPELLAAARVLTRSSPHDGVAVAAAAREEHPVVATDGHRENRWARSCTCTSSAP